MREFRKGTWAFILLLFIGVLVAYRITGFPFLIVVALVIFGALLITATLQYLAFAQSRKCIDLVRSGKYTFAAKSLIVEGDALINGTKAPHGPPGPKGVLLLNDTSLTWKPDKYTESKGFLTTSWAVGSYNVEKLKNTRDITGIAVSNYNIHLPGGVLCLQTYGSAGSLV